MSSHGRGVDSFAQRDVVGFSAQGGRFRGSRLVMHDCLWVIWASRRSYRNSVWKSEGDCKHVFQTICQATEYQNKEYLARNSSLSHVWSASTSRSEHDSCGPEIALPQARVQGTIAKVSSTSIFFHPFHEHIGTPPQMNIQIRYRQHIVL